MSDIPSRRLNSLDRLGRFWPWAIAFAPVWVLLTFIVPLRVPVPHLDGWAFVQQYQHWVESRYDWRAFLHPHYIHPSVVGKAIYFAVLHWFGGNLGILTLLSWFLSAMVAASVCLLSRPLWAGHRALGAALMVCATLTACSAAQGEAWIWDFLFQNAVPGTCLAAGLLILSSEKLSGWRIVAAALLSLIATFSFGSGFLVAILLTVPIWRGLNERTRSQRCLRTGVWLAFMGGAAWIALTISGGLGEEMDDVLRLDRPLMQAQFVLILLGQPLGKGTVFEPQFLCALLGGTLVIVFVACLICVFRRRRDREFVNHAWPWIACGAYGFATAVLICLGRMHNSLGNALAERYATFTIFFVLGTLLLAATVVRHGSAASFPVRWMRKAAGPILALFVALSVVNWERGRQAMQLKNQGMKQERALLTFANVMPLDPEWMQARSTRKSTFRLANYLADTGRLPGVKFAPDKRLDSFERGQKLPTKWARLAKPAPLDDGRWRLHGMGGLSSSRVADLILITAESVNEGERILAVTAPLLPDNFFEREAEVRRHPEFYFGWTQTVASESLPEGTLTLRAYSFEQDRQLVRPMEGVHRIERGRGRAATFE